MKGVSWEWNNQTCPIKKNHRDEMETLRLADLVDVRDVLVTERGRGLRFTDEAPHVFRIGGELGGENLQGDDTAKLRIPSSVDLPHSTGAEPLQHAVVRDCLGDCRALVGHSAPRIERIL